MFTTDKNILSRITTPHRVWQGIPSIEHSEGGRTFLTFYSGETAETIGNYSFVIMSDNETDYSEPIAAAFPEKGSRCYDPTLWIDPLSRLWFIWSVMPSEEVYACICENPDADTLEWGEEFYIGKGVMLNKPTVLSTGEWLFPIALWHPNIHVGEVLRKKSEVHGAFVYKTSDNGKTFSKLGGADVRERCFDEHMVLELKNGVLMMLVRTFYGIGVSYSYDRGNNWSHGEDSKLGGPCSRFHIKRLRSGRVLLINHYNFKGRNNLTAMLSEDDGKTYPYKLLLDERDQVSYPDATEGVDGFIRITYDRERGSFKSSMAEVYADAREILTAKITEEDIIKGELTNNSSFLKRIASKLDFYSESDPFDTVISAEALAEQLISRFESEKIIEAVFNRFNINCVNMHSFDAQKLDLLILAFKLNESRDIKKLTEIIKLIRSVPEEEKSVHPTVGRITDYICNNLSEDKQIREIAQNLGLSLYYMCHHFKEQTGITVTEYRNEQRITAEKKLLVGTDTAITDIASLCGFASAPYFAEVFTASEKISPSEYRKLHKEQCFNAFSICERS